ncbi:unnamed protein product, partial [Amoebophrya sp. A120]|eukprot:GSA120T00013844001.1
MLSCSTPLSRADFVRRARRPDLGSVSLSRRTVDHVLLRRVLFASAAIAYWCNHNFFRLLVQEPDDETRTSSHEVDRTTGARPGRSFSFLQEPGLFNVPQVAALSFSVMRQRKEHRKLQQTTIVQQQSSSSRRSTSTSRHGVEDHDSTGSRGREQHDEHGKRDLHIENKLSHPAVLAPEENIILGTDHDREERIQNGELSTLSSVGEEHQQTSAQAVEEKQVIKKTTSFQQMVEEEKQKQSRKISSTSDSFCTVCADKSAVLIIDITTGKGKAWHYGGSPNFEDCPNIKESEEWKLVQKGHKSRGDISYRCAKEAMEKLEKYCYAGDEDTGTSENPKHCQSQFVSSTGEARKGPDWASWERSGQVIPEKFLYSGQEIEWWLPPGWYGVPSKRKEIIETVNNRSARERVLTLGCQRLKQRTVAGGKAEDGDPTRGGDDLRLARYGGDGCEYMKLRDKGNENESHCKRTACCSWDENYFLGQSWLGRIEAFCTPSDRKNHDKMDFSNTLFGPVDVTILPPKESEEPVEVLTDQEIKNLKCPGEGDTFELVPNLVIGQSYYAWTYTPTIQFDHCADSLCNNDKCLGFSFTLDPKTKNEGSCRLHSAENWKNSWGYAEANNMPPEYKLCMRKATAAKIKMDEVNGDSVPPNGGKVVFEVIEEATTAAPEHSNTERGDSTATKQTGDGESVEEEEKEAAQQGGGAGSKTLTFDQIMTALDTVEPDEDKDVERNAITAAVKPVLTDGGATGEELVAELAAEIADVRTGKKTFISDEAATGQDGDLQISSLYLNATVSAIVATVRPTADTLQDAVERAAAAGGAVNEEVEENENTIVTSLLTPIMTRNKVDEGVAKDAAVKVVEALQSNVEADVEKAVEAVLKLILEQIDQDASATNNSDVENVAKLEASNTEMFVIGGIIGGVVLLIVLVCIAQCVFCPSAEQSDNFHSNKGGYRAFLLQEETEAEAARLLSAAKMQQENAARILSKFDRVDVEKALLDAGISELYAAKLAAQLCDPLVGDAAFLFRPLKADDEKIMKQFGCDWESGPEFVGRMRSFLENLMQEEEKIAAVAEALEQDGFSATAAGYLAEKLLVKQKHYEEEVRQDAEAGLDGIRRDLSLGESFYEDAKWQEIAQPTDVAKLQDVILESNLQSEKDPGHYPPTSATATASPTGVAVEQVPQQQQPATNGVLSSAPEPLPSGIFPQQEAQKRKKTWQDYIAIKNTIRALQPLPQQAQQGALDVGTAGVQLQPEAAAQQHAKKMKKLHTMNLKGHIARLQPHFGKVEHVTGVDNGLGLMPAKHEFAEKVRAGRSTTTGAGRGTTINKPSTVLAQGPSASTGAKAAGINPSPPVVFANPADLRAWVQQGLPLSKALTVSLKEEDASGTEDDDNSGLSSQVDSELHSSSMSGHEDSGFESSALEPGESAIEGMASGIVPASSEEPGTAEPGSVAAPKKKKKKLVLRGKNIKGTAGPAAAHQGAKEQPPAGAAAGAPTSDYSFKAPAVVPPPTSSFASSANGSYGNNKLQEDGTKVTGSAGNNALLGQHASGNINAPQAPAPAPGTGTTSALTSAQSSFGAMSKVLSSQQQPGTTASSVATASTASPTSNILPTDLPPLSPKTAYNSSLGMKNVFGGGAAATTTTSPAAAADSTTTGAATTVPADISDLPDVKKKKKLVKKKSTTTGLSSAVVPSATSSAGAAVLLPPTSGVSTGAGAAAGAPSANGSVANNSSLSSQQQTAPPLSSSSGNNTKQVASATAASMASSQQHPVDNQQGELSEGGQSSIGTAGSISGKKKVVKRKIMKKKPTTLSGLGSTRSATSTPGSTVVRSAVAPASTTSGGVSSAVAGTTMPSTRISSQRQTTQLPKPSISNPSAIQDLSSATVVAGTATEQQDGGASSRSGAASQSEGGSSVASSSLKKKKKLLKKKSTSSAVLLPGSKQALGSKISSSVAPGVSSSFKSGASAGTSSTPGSKQASSGPQEQQPASAVAPAAAPPAPQAFPESAHKHMDSHHGEIDSHMSLSPEVETSGGESSDPGSVEEVTKAALKAAKKKKIQEKVMNKK